MSTPDKLDLTTFFRSTTSQLLDLGQAALGKAGRVKPFDWSKGSLVHVDGNTLNVARIKQDASPETKAQLRRQIYLGAESIIERGDKTIDVLKNAEVKSIARVLDSGRLRNVLTDKYAGDKLLFATEASDAVPMLQTAHPAEAITNLLAMNRSLSLDTSSALAMAQLMAEREDVRELWTKLQDEGILADALKMRTKQEAVDLAERLLKFFKDNDVEPPPEEQPSGGGGGDGDAEGDEGQPKDGGDGSERGDNAGFGKDGSPSYENIGGVLKNELDDPGRQPEVAESGVEPTDVIIWDYTAIPNANTHAEQRIQRYVDDNDRLGHELSRLLQVRSASRYEHLQKRGKVSQSHIHRVALPTMGSGSWNASVFKKKKVSDCLDTAVTLLVDCSGSMSGEKYYAASASAVIMGNALDVVHVPFEVLGFTDSSYNAVIPVFKTFSSGWSPLNCVAGFGKMEYHLNANPDSVAVQVASERLKMRKNKRKVLIVLSDGMPSSFLRDGAGSLKAAVRHATESGVEVYGIGINSEAVRQFYKQCTVVNDYSKLSATLLSVLDNQLS